VLLLLALVVVDLSRVFNDGDSSILQDVNRCTPAPYGMLAARPSHFFGDASMDHTAHSASNLRTTH